MDRRGFLISSLHLGGGVLLGCSERGDRASHPAAKPGIKTASGFPPGAAPMALLGFEDEGDAPMHTLVGEGTQGRLFTDLSILGPGEMAVPARRFFVRTRAPSNLSSRFPWSLRIGGSVDRPFDLPLADLAGMESPQGVITLECAGNDPGGRFGLLSSGRWDGIPLKDILARIRQRTPVAPGATQVLIRGLDPPAGEASRPGASWIFSLEQLESAGAFLATSLDGRPLAPDHGHPVRLLVPGWYGCACIKWVEGISLVGEEAHATGHMADYAGRTHQVGIPDLARDFRPARMGLSAMPIRLEKWKVEDGLLYRLAGITWGGTGAGEEVQIQTGDLAWQDVEVTARRETAHGWSLWSHLWQPPQPGIYTVTLRPKDPGTRSPRLRDGHYARACRIDEV